jgi:hypothetical protein
MSKETLGDILSGAGLDPVQQQLHAALDAVLATAGPNGHVDAAAFWSFTIKFAEGRGIAEEITNSAGEFLAAQPELPKGDWEKLHAAQFAQLLVVLENLSRSGTSNAILPKSMFTALLLWVFSTLARGKHIPPLLLGIERVNVRRRAKGKNGSAGFNAARTGHFGASLARRLLVEEVYRYADEHEISLDLARRKVIPLPDSAVKAGNDMKRTWQDWQREVAGALGLSVEDLKTLFTSETSAPLPSEIRELAWAMAYRPAG